MTNDGDFDKLSYFKEEGEAGVEFPISKAPFLDYTSLDKPTVSENLR